MPHILERCTENQLKEIWKAFNLDEETVDVKRDVQTLVEWLEKQPHLPNFKDERMIRMFFLRCKASMERTKSTLESYFIHKAQNPSLFAHRDPTTAAFETCLRLMGRIPLPKLLPDLTRAVILYTEPMNDKELHSLSSDEILRNILTTLVLVSLMSGDCKGLTVVIDSKHLNAIKVSTLLPLFRKFMLFADLYTRVEKIYIVNGSSFMESILIVGRQLSRKLFQERLAIWKKGEKDLVEIIPQDNLPYEYGGTLGSRAELKDSFLKEMATWKDWLDEDSKYIADLSKVPEDKKKITDMNDFGVEGSFRKLNLE